MKINEIIETAHTRQILDSRGNPTLEFELRTFLGVFRSSCPSGASKGKNEAVSIVDDGESYLGKSISKAIFNMKNIIMPKLLLLDVEITDQRAIDEFLCKLDGTNNKRRLGVNAILPVSICFARVGAVAKNRSLSSYISTVSGCDLRIPKPHFNVINGGMHSGNNLVFQEIMIMFESQNFQENLEKGVIFYKKLGELIAEKFGKQATGVGDEGGYCPPIESLESGLDLIMETYLKHNFTNMKIAIDSAASSFYKNGFYDLGYKKLGSEDFIEFYISLIEKYPLVYSIEDPFDENDHSSWEKLMKRTRGKLRIVGDDLTVTNPAFILNAAKNKLCNVLLVKPNQIGTVTETIEAVKIARSFGFEVMVSHRSGETGDCFISDFSVGIGANYIKAGAPCRGERIAKYNQLLRIEETIKNEN